MRSTTTAVDPSLLGAATYFTASSALRFPARSLPTVKFVGKRLTVTCASPSPPPPQFGRRALMYMATASFLMPFPSLASSTDEVSLLQDEIRKILSKGKAAGLLRLVFHDAGTFDQGDKTDLIAVAGAEAVLVCGGPKIPVRLGRVDATVPDPDGKLPEESLNAAAMKQFFQKKGFSTQELVALSGAHTLGSKGFGNPVVFDNSYYKILLEKPWSSSGGMSSMIGLPSDRALVEDDECIRWITKYANDQDLFFEDFKNVYTKLVNTGATWRTV
ncbi:putative l-ascorbate peroxidase 6 [Phtheirospermum japonicum]|uniref:peroxidase n=1 Tax=Phtheirospermum japonicum TaxID=374723 RepID=A0A830BPZ1_9LAMI|nr:putative l-ascorbate peroxidase 6 [Phtheirospermum japonicum]